MTAYRSSNDYRQDLLRYDGGVNVTVTPPVIAATSSVPAVSIAVDQIVSASTVATAATTPAVTLQTGVTVSVATVSTSGLIPDSTIAVGTGVTATLAAVAATATIPVVTVSTGTGQTAFLTTINAIAAASIQLETYAVYRRVASAALDVLPYHVSTPQRRWKSHLTGLTRPKNIVILTDGTVTDREPYDRTLVSRVLSGGREEPLTDADQTALVNANYSLEVK